MSVIYSNLQCTPYMNHQDKILILILIEEQYEISGGSLLATSCYSRYVMGISSSRGRAPFELLALFHAEREGTRSRY